MLAAFGFTLVVLLRGWHPRTRVTIEFCYVFIVVFFLVGSIAVYLTLAVAMRWWPHNPRKRSVDEYEDVKRLYLDGLLPFKEWGEMGVYYQVLLDASPGNDESANKRECEFLERTQKIIDWKNDADTCILLWFGESACRIFMTEPQVAHEPPNWQRGDQWFVNWNEIAGRLAWLRHWLLEQDDL